MSKRILIVTPAPSGSRKGNRITAERWESVLRTLGHRVDLAETNEGQPADVLIALHARKSARSIAQFHVKRPDAPLIVALTGTDLYRDLAHSRRAQRSLDFATRLVLLQPAGASQLVTRWRRKARVIFQSATPPHRIEPSRTDRLEICVVGHLRAVKDPFRAAYASRRLPKASRVQVLQIGGALSDSMKLRAEREMEINPRYHWLGEMSYEKAKQRMAQCRALVLSSKLEGGANVISEAIVAGVPVLASRISGSVGLLGKDYPGFFEQGNTAELTELLVRVESDPQFLAGLKKWCNRLKGLFRPDREIAAWRKVLAELGMR